MHSKWTNFFANREPLEECYNIIHQFCGAGAARARIILVDSEPEL
jgi:hypothetical protein